MDGRQWIDDVLVTFDEMDFMPTTLLPDPEKATAEWKANLVAAIKEMDNHINVLNGKVKYLKEKVEFLGKQNAKLKRTNKAIQKQAEEKIAELYRVLFKPLKMIKRNYDVEVENDD